MEEFKYTYTKMKMMDECKEFMFKYYGKPNENIESQDKWFEKLGTLIHFICEYFPK